MVVVGSSRGYEEKLKCSGIGSWCSKYQILVETCCAGLGKCSWKCLRIVFRSGVEISEANERVEMLKTFRCLVPVETGVLSVEYRVLIPVYLCGKCTKYRSRNGGLSLLPEVLVARVFEAPEFQTISTVFSVRLSARRLLAVNLPQRVDNPPCLW